MTDPGDLTLSQIAAAFAAFERIVALALDGANDRETAEALDWRVEDVRHAASLMGFTVSPMVTRQSICPRCGYLLAADGHCDVCALRTRLERLQRVNAEEHRREVERLENAIDAVKQDTHRVRERSGTTPRKVSRHGCHRDGSASTYGGELA